MSKRRRYYFGLLVGLWVSLLAFGGVFVVTGLFFMSDAVETQGFFLGLVMILVAWLVVKPLIDKWDATRNRDGSLARRLHTL